MSLSRVSSTDHFERNSDGGGIEHRRMSFNPVTDWMPPKHDTPPETAEHVLEFEDVPKARRISQ
jgi:hypothetical protein